MLPLKRLLYLIVLFAIVAAVLIAYNISEQKQTDINTIASNDENKAVAGTAPTVKDAETVYLVCSETPEKNPVYINISHWFKDTGYNTTLSESFGSDTQSARFVIFCDENPKANTAALEAYVNGGGTAVFAAGINNDANSDLLKLLGITEIGEAINTKTLLLKDGFLPVSPQKTGYNGESRSSKLQVDGTCEIYISEEQTGTPIVYSLKLGAGSICVINGQFLIDNRMLGLLSGALCATSDWFAYPVLNVKAVFLDNFPFTQIINNSESERLYGTSADSFIKDIVWPRFLGMGLRSGTPYTACVIAENSGNAAFAPINGELLPQLGKSVLQTDGEIAYTAEAPDANEPKFYNELMSLIGKTFPNYTVNGMITNSDIFFKSAAPNANISYLRVTPPTTGQLLLNMPGYTTLPLITSGTDMDNGELLKCISVLGAYGLISHSFNFKTLVAGSAASGEAPWDAQKNGIGTFEAEVLKMAPWLSGVTLSQSGTAIQNYGGSYTIHRDKNKIELISGGGRAFILFLRDSLVKCEGCSAEKIGGGYYLVKIFDEKASIITEDKT